MCGICGVYNYRTSNPAILENIKMMTRTMVHRGPDDEGFFIDGALGFGFRRLSIIDLGGGHQPMSDHDESVWVVFNGEIYNFPELKIELKKQGHIFKTNSDTEVIIHGYKQWGIEVLNHLNGMFGLAIWDTNRKKLIVARDPMGIKIIYYKLDNDRVCFGSEIRPILALEENKPNVDPISLNLFLRYRYTPSPRTIYKGIKKLAPGTVLICENGSARVTRWYNYKPEPFSPMKTDAEAREELLELYKRAVKRQLISDVPLGILLSGGIDSGLLLGLMGLYGNEWPTFSVGYGKSFKDDELVDAARTAEIFKAQHHSTLLNRKLFENTLPRIVSFLEEPVASSSIVPMYFVCERARQDVKVAFVGQGPDELFGGYTRHLGVKYGGYWRGLPNGVQSILSNSIIKFSRRESLKRGLYSLNINERIKRYQNVFSIVPGEKVDSLFNDDSSFPGAGDEVLVQWNDYKELMADTDELGGLNFLEIRSSLPDELLMYADKLSMAHSLEIRVPYLDKEVVEYVEKLTSNFKIRNGTRKWVHRKVCNEFLPKEIMKRKKRGFAVNVVDQWFQDSVGGKIDSLLLDNESLMYKILKPKVVQEILKDHKSKKDDNHKILFSLVVFEEWLRTMQSKY